MNEKSELIKKEVYSKASRILFAMASPVRLRIIQILSHHPSRVDEIVNRTGEKVGNISQHLQKMASENIVEFEKIGTSRIYKLSDQNINAIWSSLQILSENICSDIREKVKQVCPEEICVDMTSEEIFMAVKNQKAILLDVRPPEESQYAPVDQSINVPAERVLEKLEMIPPKSTIYVFCRGRFCSLANDVVYNLRERGHTSYRLKHSHYELSKKLVG